MFLNFLFGLPIISLHQLELWLYPFADSIPATTGG
jgi:hypothetical protein